MTSCTGQYLMTISYYCGSERVKANNLEVLKIHCNLEFINYTLINENHLNRCLDLNVYE